MKIMTILCLGILSASVTAAQADKFYPFFIYFDQNGKEVSEPIYGGSFRVILKQDEQNIYWVQDFDQLNFIDQYNPAITNIYAIDNVADLRVHKKNLDAKISEQTVETFIYYYDNFGIDKFTPQLLPSLKDRETLIIQNEDKNILLKGQYQDHLRSGLWQGYDTDGKVLLSMQYDQGLPIAFEWRDNNGAVIKNEVPIFESQNIELESNIYYFNNNQLMYGRYPGQSYSMKRVILWNDQRGVLIQDYDQKNQPMSDAYYLQCDDVAQAVKNFFPNCTVGPQIWQTEYENSIQVLKGKQFILWHYLIDHFAKNSTWEPIDEYGRTHGTAKIWQEYYKSVALTEGQYEHGRLLHEVTINTSTQDKLEETVRYPENSKYYHSVKYSGSHPYTSEYFYFAEDGQKVLHGPQTIWLNYASGANFLQSIKDYEHGKLNGRAYEFSSDGTFLTKEEYYQNGRPSGTWTQRNKKDVLSYQSVWVQPDKFVIRYSHLSDGRIYEIPMLDGQRHGNFKVLDQEGQTLETMPYVKGKQEGISHGVYSNGDRYENNYRNDQRDGEHRTWYANGTLKSLSFYDEGWSVGLHQLWDEDGNLLQEDDYKAKGKRVRSTKWWANGHKKQEKIFEDHYDDGRMKVGTITAWDNDGHLKKIMNVKAGACIGKVIEYDDNQKMIERECSNDEDYIFG